MATSASQQLYPFSTEDGKAIPLDVIRPRRLSIFALAAEAVTTLTIPAGMVLASVYSSIDCYMNFDVDAAYGVFPQSLNSGLLIPASTVLTVALPRDGLVRVVPLIDAAGWLSLQEVEKWAGIGLQRQISRR